MLIAALVVNAKSLVLVLTDETRVYYLLENENSPVMTFDKDNITVRADVYSFNGVSRFYISNTDDTTEIGSVKTAGRKFDGSTLYLNAKGCKVSLYNADGKLVNANVSENGGVTAVSMASLPAGVYIVKTGNTSFKIVIP